MKDKSIQVYKWIRKRYDHYNKIEGKDCGDKYQKQIFRDVSKLFKMSVDDVHEHYNYYITNILKESTRGLALREHFEQFKENPEKFKAIKLHNKKVRVKSDEILKDTASMNKKFIDFVEKNRDKTFTAQTDSKIKTLYNLKENEFWLFGEKDLEEVE